MPLPHIRRSLRSRSGLTGAALPKVFLLVLAGRDALPRVRRGTSEEYANEGKVEAEKRVVHVRRRTRGSASLPASLGLDRLKHIDTEMNVYNIGHS
jgi:hypothetical protein